jgi:ectoine hydroxylase-related dioxygenase (phytanoyl-CoA dioxygenase family)
MGRGTHQHMTCWVPYGDISFTLGGLMVLEGSHKRMDLLENYVYRDVDAFCENKAKDAEKAKKGEWTFTGTLSHNPPAVRNKFGGRWLTTEFKAGDFITFGMFLVHASLDNRSENRLRISSDSRYQRASEAVDERWVGPNPPGHSLAGKRGRIC